MSATPYMPENDVMGNDILVFGYTGAYCDPVTSVYSLGNGYRVYLPELMRFAAPDDWSPFGKGGVNPYLYSSGDPINHSDPSGHISVFAWAGIVGGALGIAAAFSPLALAAIGAVGTDIAIGTAVATVAERAGILGTAGFASGVTADLIGVMSFSLEDRSKPLSAIFAGVSTAFGVVSLGFSLTGSLRYLRRIIPAVGRAEERETALRGRLAAALQQQQTFIENIGGIYGHANLDLSEALDLARVLSQMSQAPDYEQLQNNAGQFFRQIQPRVEERFVAQLPDPAPPAYDQPAAPEGAESTDRPGPSRRRADLAIPNPFPNYDDLESIPDERF